MRAAKPKSIVPAESHTPARRRRRPYIPTPADTVRFLQKEFPEAFDAESHRLASALRAVGRIMDDYADEWLLPIGLTFAKYNYLNFLFAAAGQRLSHSDLGRYVHATNGAVSTMVSALERDGFVRRVPNHDDGRSSFVQLTAKGARLLPAAIGRHHSNLQRTLGSLNRADKRRLTGHLYAILRAFESAFGVAADSKQRSSRNGAGKP